MQKSTRVRYYTRSIALYTKNNAALLMFALLFLFGLLCATLAFSILEPEPRKYITDITQNFVNIRLTAPLKYNFISAVLSALVFPLILFICGFCAIAQPLIALASFVRGLGTGFSLAALYAHYGTSAMGFGILYVCTILPVSITIMLCSVESMKFSIEALLAMRQRDKAAFYPLSRYIGKYMAFVVFCVLSAAMEAILYVVFANYVFLG